MRCVAYLDVDLVRAQEAEERRHARGRLGVVTRMSFVGGPVEPPPTRHCARTRFWIEGRDRAREEAEQLDQAGPSAMTVWDRGRWWSWTPGHGDPISNTVPGGEPEDPAWSGSMDELLDPVPPPADAAGGALAPPHRAVRGPEGEVTLLVSYHREDAVHHLQLTQSRAGATARPVVVPVGGEPESFERDGTRYLVVPPAEPGDHAAVLWERDGTALELSSSTFGADELLDLAASAIPYG